MSRSKSAPPVSARSREVSDSRTRSLGVSDSSRTPLTVFESASQRFRVFHSFALQIVDSVNNPDVKSTRCSHCLQHGTHKTHMSIECTCPCMTAPVQELHEIYEVQNTKRTCRNTEISSHKLQRWERRFAAPYKFVYESSQGPRWSSIISVTLVRNSWS